MKQWNLLTQWIRLTKFINVYLINLKNKNMKIGDKVKVVWNDDVCSKQQSNTYDCNGKVGTILEFCSERYGLVEIDIAGKTHIVYARALKLVEDKTEYYEYVMTSIDSFTEGKIYKVLDPYYFETHLNFIDNQGDKNGFAPYNHKYFKPSTKEAFDKQNNKTNMKKEIIGYKSPIVIGYHPKGELYTKLNKYLYVLDLIKDSTFYSVPVEIAETWEPVYKEDQTKTLVLGTNKIKIVISKDKIDVDGGNIIDIVQFKFLYQALTNTEIKGSNRSYDVLFPKGVKIGCSEFEVEEIKLIIDTYNEINK